MLSHAGNEHAANAPGDHSKQEDFHGALHGLGFEGAVGEVGGNDALQIELFAEGLVAGGGGKQFAPNARAQDRANSGNPVIFPSTTG